MCGRTACTLSPSEFRRACRYKDNTSGVDTQPEWIDSGRVYKPSHNMCPTDTTPVLVSGSHVKSKELRALVPMIWGMIPPWHKGDIKSHGLTTHNCRLEGVTSSKLYQAPLFSGQRCVIICNGFYEWQTTKGKGFKQPYFIYNKQEEGVSILDAESLGPANEDDCWTGPTLLHIAGLFNTFTTAAGEQVFSYSMITMESNAHFSWLHHRMPAVLESEQMIEDWLDNKISSKQAVSILKQVSCLSWHPVTNLVNNSRNKDTNCNKPRDFRGSNAAATNNPLMKWLQKGATPKSQCGSCCIEMKSLSLVACLLLAVVGFSSAAIHTEAELAAYLAGEYERRASEECKKVVTAEWNYNTDVLNVTKEDALAEQSLLYAQFEKEQWAEWFRDADWENFQEDIVKRQVQFLSVLGTAALDDASLTELNSRSTAMQTIYSTAKICPFANQQCDLETEGLALDPGMEAVISESTNYDELTYVWTAWRNASGAKMRDDYKRYVELSNEAAVANGFSDMGEMWRADYESDTFIQDLAELWAEVEPLYLSLHSYVRDKLVTRYGELLGPDDGLLPAQVLGNMWAQTWSNLYDLVIPYPDASPVDVTNALNEQGYDALRMFETSDDFYLSLGLIRNDMSYNESLGAMLVRPPDREVVCHASAWDFCDKTDYRIKMCTKVNSEDFVTIHHEMGHIEYFLQYRDQPVALRKGANPGFHEAVGDTISLSVSTPQHLEKIGLLANYTASDEAGINALMRSALDKIAFLPFGYLIDQWRWDVFSGAVPETEWNAHWWKLREDIQHLRAPVERTENDFDPGAKYHVPADSQYIAYFVAHILQFQFHKAACIEAGKYNPDDVNSEPLFKCDIFQSTAAGTLLSNGLKLGGSKHWSEALFVMTGERKLDGSAILEYFAPLQDFLNQQAK